MQKVSKQSLAMLALSILLAISIALTFTFAALAAQEKTATGTITFEGGLSIAFSGFDQTTETAGITFGGNADAITVEFKQGAFELSGENFVLSEAAKTQLAKGVVTITSAVDKKFTWTAVIDDASLTNADITEGTLTGTSSYGADATTTLAAIISDITISGAESESFTITFNANYVA